MNRITRLALAVIVFVTANIFQVKADDYDFAVNNVYYKVESMDERTCAVCAPNSTRTGEYQDDIVVPPTVTYNGATFTVIAIDKEAFWLCPITFIKLILYHFLQKIWLFEKFAVYLHCGIIPPEFADSRIVKWR